MKKQFNRTSEVLKAARDLIVTPDKWCKGYWAFNSMYQGRDPNDPEACMWCARGALFKVTEQDFLSSEVSLLSTCQLLLGKVIPNDLSIAEFNDLPKTRHSDVLAVYDAAIAMAEKQENAQ